MMKSDLALWELVRAIVAGNATEASRLLAASPPLASASFHTGATRQTAKKYYFDQIGRYVFAGDTALHVAAAAYETELIRKLITAGADVDAGNRLGDEPCMPPLLAFLVRARGIRLRKRPLLSASLRQERIPTWSTNVAYQRCTEPCARIVPRPFGLSSNPAPIPHARIKAVQRRCNPEHGPRW